ncbi:MAG: helix-turn-helix transcriptional regulator [Ginsengibacter sp.]
MATKKYSETWLGYLEKLYSKDFDHQKFNIDGIERMFMFNSSFHSLFFHSIPTIYLLDYTTGKYLFISKNSHIVLGYESKEWIDNGVDFTIDLYNKEDLRLYNEKIFPDKLQLIKNIPLKEQENCIFSNNYRLKNSKGEFVNLLQRNCFIKSDANGLPLISLGMVINIEHYKKENPVIQVVEKINLENNSAETIYKKVYYLNEENIIFSKREREVLLWVTDGLTSKEIGDKLFISEGTVINHRKNMILKSGTKNAAELISFAMQNYII